MKSVKGSLMEERFVKGNLVNEGSLMEERLLKGSLVEESRG